MDLLQSKNYAKSIYTIEAASMLAKTGKNILVLCPNKEVKNRLIKLAKEINGNIPIGLKILTVEDLSKSSNQKSEITYTIFNERS